MEETEGRVSRVVLTYIAVLAAVHYFDSRFTEAMQQPVEALGIMFGLPVMSLWWESWISRS